MPGAVLQIYASATGGTQDALASIDVPADCTLESVAWAISADLNAGGESQYVELSFGSTNGLTSNDARQVLSTVRMRVELTTSGVFHGFVNFLDMLPDIQLNAGERLYLHSVSAAGVVAVITCHLHCADLPDAFGGRPSIRRR